jgi:hypothetical protein
MKWLFIIVALLNIIWGGYHFLFIDSFIDKEDLINYKNQQIILLKELDNNELKELHNKKLVLKVITEDKEKQIRDNASILSDTSIMDNKIRNHNSIKTSICFQLGPLTKDVMNDVHLLLEKKYQNKLSFGIETTSAITYYRIYIPPLKNKQEIDKTLALLDKNGLTDHYVMSINGRKNAIALGVFKQRSAAEYVAAKANDIALATTIEAISDDKNSLYQLLVIFQKNQKTSLYQEVVLEKKLISHKCNK